MQMKLKPLPQLEDDELKTPMHDRICILLLNKEVQLAYIEKDVQLQKLINYYATHEITRVDKYTNTDYKTIPYKTNYLSHTIEIETPTLEKVLKTQNGFILGYLDLWVTINIKISFEYSEELGVKEIKTKNRQISFGIEVKPTIRSVGEVMRQLQTYKQHTGSHIVLISASTENKDIFEGQGFSFWVVA